VENYKSKSGKRYADDLERGWIREWPDGWMIKSLVCFHLGITSDGCPVYEDDGLRV
jgi:hypothetical protein